MFGLGDVWGFIPAPEELFSLCCQDNDSLIFWGQQTRLCWFWFFVFPLRLQMLRQRFESSVHRIGGIVFFGGGEGGGRRCDNLKVTD